MPDVVRRSRPVAPGDTVILDDGTPALVLHLRPTEPAAEYEVAATTATPWCSHCERTCVTHADGDRWQCPKCSRAIGREALREWAIKYMIALGRFADPGDSERWRQWREEILADSAAAEKLVHGFERPLERRFASQDSAAAGSASRILDTGTMAAWRSMPVLMKRSQSRSSTCR